MLPIHAQGLRLAAAVTLLTALTAPPTAALQGVEKGGPSADGLLEAQPASHAAALAAPETRVHYSQQQDGLWAAGRTYKVRAHTGGFTYFPFIGPDAERTWPVNFRLAEAAIGGTPLELNERAEVRRAENRIVLDRGPVDVTYDMGLLEIEQSFVIDAAGSQADLVLDLEVTTDLSGRADGAGFRFDSAGGGVLYGSAIVLDGAGRRADVDATLEDGHLRLTVGAEFLRAAVGTIVVDPIIRSWTVDNRDKQQLDPDVSYDLTSETFIYVYETGLTAADTDIFFRTIDINGNFVDEGYFLLSGDAATDPAVANVNDGDLCLCVFTRNVNGMEQVWGRRRNMVNGTLSAEVRISPFTLSDNHVQADVGGSALPGGNFLIAWTRVLPNGDTRIWTRQMFPSGSLGATTITDSDPDYNLDSVAVSESVGEAADAGYWSLIYRGVSVSGGGTQIRGMQINPNGSLRESSNVLFTEAAGVQLLEFDVSDTITPSGGPPTYMVVYTRRDGSDYDTWIMTCRDNERLFRFHLQALEHSRIERTQIEPRIASTRDEFVVSYLELSPSSFNFDVYATCIDVTEDRPAISERRTYLGDTRAGNAGGCAIASRFASGVFTSRWTGYGWSRWDTVGLNTTFNVFGGVVFSDEPSAVGIQYQACIGTENSTGKRGFIIVQGDQSIDQTKTLLAGDLPLTSFGYFIVGSTVGNTPMAGGSDGTLCLGGTVGRYSLSAMSTGTTGTLVLAIDPTELPVPNGTEAAMAGTGRVFQAWHRDSSGGPPTSNFTNAATLIFR